MVEVEAAGSAAYSPYTVCGCEQRAFGGAEGAPLAGFEFGVAEVADGSTDETDNVKAGTGAEEAHLTITALTNGDLNGVAGTL